MAPTRSLSPLRPEPPRQEFTAMAQALLVDAVAQSGRHVPFRWNFERREIVSRQKQGLCRDEVVVIAMYQKDWRPHLDLTRHCIGFGAVRQYEQPRIADDRGGPFGTPKPHMQRHHAALAESHQGKRASGQVVAFEFLADKALKDRG